MAMDPPEDEYSSLVSKVVDELSAAGYGTGDREIAQTVIKLGQNSKSVQEFNDRLSKNVFLFRNSLVTSLWNLINLVFPQSTTESSNTGGDSEKKEQESFKIEVIREEPEFLRRQLRNLDEVLPLEIPDSLLHRAAANHRGLIEKHRSELGDKPEYAPTSHSNPPRSADTIKEGTRLPIFEARFRICASVSQHRQLVIVGESGSGKTTQIPQYLSIARKWGTHILKYSALNRPLGMIAVIQPTKSATIVAARRVAEELGCVVGERVGYSVGSEVRSRTMTEIKYMTESVLWDEIIADPKLSDYAVIMIDDAHERSITMDVILGLIMDAIRLGAEFRLIILSATVREARRLSRYFFDCEILRIPMKQFFLPVQVMCAKQPCSDPIQTALEIIAVIHTKEPLGDILLFLSCRDEVEFVCRLLSHWARSLPLELPKLIVLPAWRFLRGEIDLRVFEPTLAKARKVVVTTAVAETLMAAIDGILYVVDVGLTERRMFDARQVTDMTVVAPISREAIYRRTILAALTNGKPGTCIRLYTEAASREEMSSFTEPEIQTANLGSMALQMIASGVMNIWNFEFIDRPPPQHLASGLQQLYFLGALDDDGALTELGRNMALFPLDPHWSKTLVTGVNFKCSHHVLTVIAMAQAGRIFFRPSKNGVEADQRRSGFFRSEGDHLSLIDVYETWRCNKCSSEWCVENFVNPQALIRAHTLRIELATIMNDRRRWKVTKNPKQNVKKIMKAITSGLFFHAARRNSVEDCYQTVVGNHRVYIHPRSALYRQKPSWVIYNELVWSDDKEYMVGVMTIDPNWLAELAPTFFTAQEKQYIELY